MGHFGSVFKEEGQDPSTMNSLSTVEPSYDQESVSITED